MGHADLVTVEDQARGPQVRVTVVAHYDGYRRVFAGTEEMVKRDLFTNYPWLVPRCGDAAISEVVRVLDRAQAFTAVVQVVSAVPS